MTVLDEETKQHGGEREWGEREWGEKERNGTSVTIQFAIEIPNREFNLISCITTVMVWN